MNQEIDIVSHLEAVEKARDAGNLKEYLSSMDKLENLYLDAAFAALEQAKFENAYKSFAEAQAVNEELAAFHQRILEEMSPEEREDKELLQLIDENREEAFFNAQLSEAFANFCEGQFDKLNRNPGNACKKFKQAHDLFMLLKEKTDKVLFQFYAMYSKATETFSEGLEEMLLGNLNSAKTAFQRASLYLDEITEELAQASEEEKEKHQIEQLQQGIQAEINNCEAYYSWADARDQSSKGNYLAAAEQFGVMAERLHTSLQQLSGQLPHAFLSLQTGEYYSCLGYHYLAKGEALREQGQWEEALDHYAKVAAIWKKGAAAYMKSGLPQGLALQEMLINEASRIPELYVRRCKEDRTNKTRIKELEDQLKEIFDSARHVGVTVNTSQQMVSMVNKMYRWFKNWRPACEKTYRSCLRKSIRLLCPTKSVSKLSVRPVSF